MKKYRFYFQDIDATGQPQTELRYDVEGWKAYGVSFGRETNVSNVVKSYTNSWTFIKEDASYLKSIFVMYGPNRRVKLLIKRLDNAMAGTYEVEYAGFIDLTQAKWDVNTFTAPVNEGGFFTALENKWDTEYGIPHNSVLNYAGNILTVDARMESTDTFVKGVAAYSVIGYFLIGQQLQDKDNGQDNILFDVKPKYVDATFNAASQLPLPGCDTFVTPVSKSDAFFKLGKGGELKSLQMDAHIKMDIRGNEFQILVDNETYTGRWQLFMFAARESAFDPNTGEVTLIPYQNCDCFMLDNAQYNVQVPTISGHLTYLNYTIPMDIDVSNSLSAYSSGNEETYFFLMLRVQYGQWSGPQYPIAVYYMNDTERTTMNCENVEIRIDYKPTLSNAADVSATPVPDMFRNLIRKINDGRYNVVADDSRLSEYAQDDLLSSGMGLRSILTGGVLGSVVLPIRYLINTSFAKFAQFVYICYGLKFCVDYERSTDTYRCYFDTIQSIYTAAEIAHLERTSEYSVEVARDMLYTKITAGYEVDDDVLMGQSEFNCKNTYSTPNTELEENELSLVSPYSAASFSIDTYILRNYGNLEDGNEDDGKIYVLAGKYLSERPINPQVAELWGWDVNVVSTYELDRSIVPDSGLVYPETAFNVKFSPKRILLRHDMELQSFFAFNAGYKIALVTCEYNRGLVSGGIVEEADITIGDSPLFVPLHVNISAAARERLIGLIEADRCGYFSFSINGVTVRGFIANDSSAVNINPMNEQASEFKLLAKSTDGLL